MAAVKFTAKLTATTGGAGKLKTRRLFSSIFSASSSATGKLTTRRLFTSTLQAFGSFKASLTAVLHPKEAEYVNGGRWRKKLGSVGYILSFWEAPSPSGSPPEFDVAALPPGVTYKVNSANSFAWKLREPIGAQNASAVENFLETETTLATWYGAFFTVEIQSVKQFYGTITFYCIDEQNGGLVREQTITNGSALRTVSNFTEGQYVSFTEAIPPGGIATFTFTCIKGSNAVCSAVFFDATPVIHLQAVENGGTGQLYTGTSSAETPAVGANANETWLLNNVFAGT